MRGQPSAIVWPSTPLPPFDPQSISGLKVWLKADALALSDNSLVATWTDSSGNGLDATASGSSKPTFKTAIQNGLPILRFDGVANKITTPALSLTEPNTVFLMGKQTSKATEGRFLDTPTGPGRQLLGLNASGFFDLYAGSASLNDSTDHSGAFIVLSAVFNGASTIGYLNGTQAVSGNPGTGYTSLSSALVGSDGGSSFLTGDMGEVLIYDSALSAGNRQSVESYLKTKWGTP